MKTITVAWKRQPGADGYEFVRNGVVVSRTFEPSTTATFWRGSRYAVRELRRTPDNKATSVRRAVVYATPSPNGSRRKRLVSLPARKVDFAPRVASRTSKTITFRWKRQPGADGYEFVRNGVVVSRTFVRSTTMATFWKGSSYGVGVLRRVPGGKAISVWRAFAFTDSSPAKSTTPKAPRTSPVPNPRIPAPPATATPSPKPSAPGTPPTASAPPASPAPAAPPAPPAFGPGGTLTLSGSYSPDAFDAAVTIAPPGLLNVRGPYTLTNDIEISRPGLRLDGANVTGGVLFTETARGSSFVNGSADSFAIFGADDVLVEGSTFEGHGEVKDGAIIWDEPTGNTPDGWVIPGNTFRNFYIDNGQDVHSQAIYVGYSTDGLIENTFTNNGTTSHIFFTWFGNLAEPSTSFPRNICVRGNTFNETHGAYYDVNFRAEIPVSANIKIQRNASSSDARFFGSC
jgi:hypothetical protein